MPVTRIGAKMNKQIPTEAQEQTTLFQWAAYQRPLEIRCMFSIPNGGSRNQIEALHLKQQGVKAGVPDIFVPCMRGGYGGLFIEMKRRKGGRLSEAQREMIDNLRCCGYRVEVCEGWEKARDVIKEYLYEHS